MADTPRDVVYKLLADRVLIGPVKGSTLRDSSLLEEDLVLDSLDRWELISDLEEALDIDIPVDAAREVRTVGNVIALVEQCVAA